MPNWIIEPKSVPIKVHIICYERVMHPATVLQFECNPEGVIDENALTRMSKQSLEMCRHDMFGDYRAPSVIKTERTQHTDGVIRCRCGAHHEVKGQRNTTCIICSRHYDPHGLEIEMEEDSHGF